MNKLCTRCQSGALRRAKPLRLWGVNISLLVIFCCLHIWWCQNWLIYSWIEKHLINCLHQNKSEVLSDLANIYDGIFFVFLNSNVNLNKFSRKNFHLRCLTRSSMCLCRWIQHSFQNSGGDISLTASEDGIILKFRSVDCLSISQDDH